MKPRLLILGGSRYYSRSIRSAQELGCEVVVTDKNPHAEAFSLADYAEPVDITDFDQTLNIAKKYKINGILALNDFGVPTAAYVSEQLKLPGLSQEAARLATNKKLMREAWKRDGVPSVRYCCSKDVKTACEEGIQLGVFPLIVKPTDSRGGGSRGVRKVNCVSELEAAVEYAKSFYSEGEVIVEEFIEGIEHSVETVTYEGRTHIIAISDKIKTPPPYRVDHSVIYPSIISESQEKDVIEVCLSAIKSLGINYGAAHVELCTTAEGPKLFEIGARCGGGGTPDPIIPFHNGIQLLKEVARLALGKPPESLTPRFSRGCVYRFIIPKPGKIKSVSGFDELVELEGILDAEVFLKPDSIVPEVKQGRDRAGFLIAGAETRDMAIALANDAESKLRISYID